MITPLAGNGTCAPPKGVAVLLMNAQTVDETKSTIVCPSPGIRNHTFTLTLSAVVTGRVQLETSNDPTYTGDWSLLGGGPIDLSTFTGKLEVAFSDIAIIAARARIETAVAGGNVSVSYIGT